MIKAGTTVYHTVYRQTAGGKPSLGKVLADFATEIRLGGAIQAIVCAVAEGTVNTIDKGRPYVFSFTAPATSGDLSLTISCASGTDYITAGVLVDDVSIYDIDSVGALIATATTVASTTVTNSTSASMFQGDSLKLDLSIRESALTSLGAASLAAIDTLTCGWKLVSNDSGDAQDANPTVSIVSDSLGNRVLRATLLAFPAAFNVPDGQQSVSSRVDIRATEGTTTFIIATCDVTIYWKATTA